MKDWKFHCAVLGVSENAELKEVRKAFRKLALRLHPDKHNNSEKAKNDFQQLNESYHFVAAALIGRHHKEDSFNHSRPEAPRKTHRPEQERTKPILKKAPPVPGGTTKFALSLWAPISAAGIFVLLFSFLLDGAQESLPEFKPDSSELLSKNWCLINTVQSGGPSIDISELWPQAKCEERCESIATGLDVSCTWNGTRFHSPKTPATQAMPAVAESPVPCEISIDRWSGTNPTPYKGQTQATCFTICEELIKLRPRDTIRCHWNKEEFLSQIPKAKPPQPEPQIPTPSSNPSTRDNSSSYNLAENLPTRESSFPPPSGEYRATCFMSIVSEEGASADSFPNDTRGACEARCLMEIGTSPMGKEIKCAFAGKSLITYIPDPMDSYLSRGPASSDCQISLETGTGSKLLRSRSSGELSCKAYCRAERLRRNESAVINCLYMGIPM